MHTFRRLALSLVVLMMIVAATPAFAQQNAQSGNSGGGGVGIGLEFGLTRATIHAEGAGDFFTSRNGLMGGIWFGGNRNGTVGFMGEITYVVKATRANDINGVDLKLHYLEIPALLRVNIGQHSRNGVIVYPLFGPVVDIQLKADANGFDVKDRFNGYDIGVIGGVGFEAARMGVEVRGNWGLKTLEKVGNGFSGLTDTKNFTVEALAKVRIN